ncbi:MAG TPA: SDR family NAD(P)-dependent oxidoreductase [Epsilonproteobacteria bacterium]|nr:SDR family NAD(P)-dependent oxidoreductase [Campylobacterota bacterium]
MEYLWGIDIALYNAGIYESMRVDALSIESISAICEVNYLGAVRFLTQIIPLFKEQGRGHIAFNVSISSYFGLPFGGGATQYQRRHCLIFVSP